MGVYLRLILRRRTLRRRNLRRRTVRRRTFRRRIVRETNRPRRTVRRRNVRRRNVLESFISSVNKNKYSLSLSFFLSIDLESSNFERKNITGLKFVWHQSL